MRHAKNTPNTKHLIQRGSACCGAGWKVALRDAAARRQGDSRCVCSDGGAVGGRFAAPGGLREQRVEQSEISEHSEHSEGLADARSFSRCSALRSSAGLMAAICLPGEVRRPVPGYYAPGGALGGLSVGAGASLRAAHCFSIAWISFSSFS